MGGGKVRCVVTVFLDVGGRPISSILSMVYNTRVSRLKMVSSAGQNGVFLIARVIVNKHCTFFCLQ